MAGYNDRVRNLIFAYCWNSGKDIAMRYLYEKADIQTAAKDHSYLKKPFTQYWVENALKVGREDITRIENDTRHQSKSEIWFYHRKWRLTASNFGSVYHATSRRDMNKFYEHLLHPPTLSKAAVLYGQHYEGAAIIRFEQATALKVNRCGLFVCKDFPFLAASPDGVVNGGSALVEVKCPYSCKGQDITVEKVPYMEKVGTSGMKLKVGSNYYCQVQGQMAITGITRCYFVLYSSETLFFEVVEYNHEFWESELLPKLVSFFQDYSVFVASSL